MKIDILMPSFSQYGVLQHFTHKFYEALCRTEHTCRLLEGDECILAPLKSPPDLTIGFNGALIMEDDTLFCDHINVPHVAILLDPSFRFLHLAKSPNIVLACDDRHSCEMLYNLDFNHAFFLPHGVERDLAPISNLKRIYDIAMLATYIPSEQIREGWRDQFPSEFFRKMEKTIDLVEKNPDTSFIKILQTVFQSSLTPTNIQKKAFEEIELYLKGIDRIHMINGIEKYEVHIFGDSMHPNTYWKDCLKSHAIIHPPVPYVETQNIMQQCKIVLNSNIKNMYGAHERIFSAGACEAAVVTNDNEYLRENFKEGKEIILYQHNNFAKMNQDIDELLTNKSKWEKMTAAARKKVMAHHTWDHRLQSLLKAVSKFKRN